MEAVKDGTPGSTQIKRHSRGEEYFTYLLRLQPIDRWERVRRNGLLFQYGRYLGLIYFSGDQGLLNSMRELFRLAEGSYASLIGMATTLVEHGNSSHWEQVSAWLDRAEPLKYEALKKQTQARLYYLKGSLLEKQGKRVEAVASYAKSRDIYPHPENKALEALEKYKVNFKGVNPPRRESPKPVLPSLP